MPTDMSQLAGLRDVVSPNTTITHDLLWSPSSAVFRAKCSTSLSSIFPSVRRNQMPEVFRVWRQRGDEYSTDGSVPPPEVRFCIAAVLSGKLIGSSVSWHHGRRWTGDSFREDRRRQISNVTFISSCRVSPQVLPDLSMATHMGVSPNCWRLDCCDILSSRVSWRCYMSNWLLGQPCKMKARRRVTASFNWFREWNRLVLWTEMEGEEKYKDAEGDLSPTWFPFSLALIYTWRTGQYLQPPPYASRLPVLRRS